MVEKRNVISPRQINPRIGIPGNAYVLGKTAVAYPQIPGLVNHVPHRPLHGVARARIYDHQFPPGIALRLHRGDHFPQVRLLRLISRHNNAEQIRIILRLFPLFSKRLRTGGLITVIRLFFLLHALRRRIERTRQPVLFQIIYGFSHIVDSQYPISHYGSPCFSIGRGNLSLPAAPPACRCKPQYPFRGRVAYKVSRPALTCRGGFFLKYSFLLPRSACQASPARPPDSCPSRPCRI